MGHNDPKIMRKYRGRCFMRKAVITGDGARVYAKADVGSHVVKELRYGDEVYLGAPVRSTEIVYVQNIGIPCGNDPAFIRVVLSDLKEGYISGDTAIHIIRTAMISQEGVKAHARAYAASAIINEYRRGDRVHILDQDMTGDSAWIKIRDDAGRVGFVEKKTEFDNSQDFTASLVEVILPSGDNRLYESFEGIKRDLAAGNLKSDCRARGLGESDDKKAAWSTLENMIAINSMSRYRHQMTSGVLWAFGGAVATLVGYAYAASSPGGGTYLIFWGATVFGLFDFFRGFTGWLECKESEPRKQDSTVSSKAALN
jgi:hypothetical protein